MVELLKERAVVFMKNMSYWKVARFFLMAFLVVYSFQVRKLVFNMSYLFTGNFNEYTSFFIYLGDILLLGALLFFAFAHFYDQKADRKISFGYVPLTISILVMILVFFGGIFVSEVKILHLMNLFRVIELFILYFLLVNDLLNRRETIFFLLLGVMLQSVIAVGQYLLQGSVGLHIFGEPHVNNVLPGVAKIDIAGDKVLRAYGAFPHPNVLAGTVVIMMFFSNYLLRDKLLVLIPVVIILLMALLLSFSRSAFLAMGGSLLLYFSLSEKKIGFKNILLWSLVLVLIMVVFNMEWVIYERIFLGDDLNSVTERLNYISSSKHMILDHPFGVGLGHFTIFLQDYVYLKLDPWLFQPVHNVYLLVLNETGILGAISYISIYGLVFYWLFKSSLKNRGDNKIFGFVLLSILVVIAMINIFDHYFFTLYQGQVIYFVFLSLASNFVNKSLLPSRKS